jgi:hypothetical protein
MAASTIAVTTLTKLAAEKCRTSSNVGELRAVFFPNAFMPILSARHEMSVRLRSHWAIAAMARFAPPS